MSSTLGESHEGQDHPLLDARVRARDTEHSHPEHVESISLDISWILILTYLASLVAMGSSMQIALVVAPVLVIAGHLIGQPLGLEFTVLQLLAIYWILAVTFYFV